MNKESHPSIIQNFRIHVPLYYCLAAVRKCRLVSVMKSGHIVRGAPTDVPTMMRSLPIRVVISLYCTTDSCDLSLVALETCCFSRDRNVCDPHDSFDRCCIFVHALLHLLCGGYLPHLPGEKIEMAHVDLKIADTAALGSTAIVSSGGLTPNCLRLKCGAPLAVSTCCARVVGTR